MASTAVFPWPERGLVWQMKPRAPNAAAVASERPALHRLCQGDNVGPRCLPALPDTTKAQNGREGDGSVAPPRPHPAPWPSPEPRSASLRRPAVPLQQPPPPPVAFPPPPRQSKSTRATQVRDSVCGALRCRRGAAELTGGRSLSNDVPVATGRGGGSTLPVPRGGGGRGGGRASSAPPSSIMWPKRQCE